MIPDKYQITAATIKEPPHTLLSRLRFLGPGFILSASIVGSGELIATTILGARAGFIMFWIIIVSCLVKVAIQLQFGKNAILTGETAMYSFNKLPGWRIGKANWSVWMVFILTLLKVVQIGGMLGGAALVLSMIFPSVPVYMWVFPLAIAVALMIYGGYYKLIEKTSLVMIGFFTILTIASLIAVRYTAYSFEWSDIVDGLRFRLPGELVFLALGAFGITGVGSDEIISYNYWCLEKGYASYAGPRDDSKEWKERAEGWIKVMYLDAIAAMIIYTIVTAAFYILGASILHSRGEIPEGNAVISVLAGIYTQTLGEGVKFAFLAGAFFVLFSSVFATMAYWSRLFSDIWGRMGWIDFSDPVQRKKAIAWFSWVFPMIWAVMFLFINLPVLMIFSGGVVGSVLLLVVLFAAFCFRYREKQMVRKSFIFDILFVLSALSILLVAVYGLMQVMR